MSGGKKGMTKDIGSTPVITASVASGRATGGGATSTKLSAKGARGPL